MNQNAPTGPFWSNPWFHLGAGLGSALVVGGAGCWLLAPRLRLWRTRLDREKRVGESQARLALVLESTSDVVAFTDPLGAILYLNQAGGRLLGARTGEGTLSGPFLQYVHPSSRNEFEQSVLPLTSRDGHWAGELLLQSASGQEIPVALTITVHRLPDRQIDFISILARDISKARRAALIQDAMRQLSADLTAPMELSDLGRTVAAACRRIFVHDAMFLVLLDREGRPMPGAYTEDTPIGSPAPVVLQTNFDRLSTTVRRVMDGTPLLINRDGRPEDPTLEWLSKGGTQERRSASLMFAPIRWEGGCVGILSAQSYTPFRYRSDEVDLLQTVADHCGAAVARLFSEQALRESEEKYRAIFDEATDAILVCDRQGRIRSANGPACRALGTTASELHGRLIVEVDAGEPSNSVLANLSLLQEGPPFQFETLHRRKDGTTYPAEVRLGRLSINREQVVFVSFRDISERQRSSQAQASLEAQLRQAQKMEAIGTLAGGIAHDFNNILTVIMASTELALEEVTPDSNTHSLLASIKSSADRARDLVAQILTFSRRKDQQRQVIALWPTLAETIRLLRASLPTTIEIRSSSTAGAEDSVMADATQMHQILMNLGTNAGHAMRERGGVLEITAEVVQLNKEWRGVADTLPRGRYVQLTIRDTGHGMPPEVVEKIFDPFFTTKGPGEGTGLGLAVVHGIVRNHRGGISVASVPGQGTTFQILLPVVRKQPAPVKAALELVKGRGQRIMVVDDEEKIALTAARILERAGYQTVVVSDPVKAEQLFQESPGSFDLLLTDLTMPGLTGDELIRRLQLVRPDFPAVICTGFAGGLDPTRGQVLSRTLVLEKPYDVVNLTKVVDEALRRSRSEPPGPV